MNNSLNSSQSERTPLLEAVHLTKRYDDRVLALHDVSFSVWPGQVYAILGGNGAGKTTTINIFLNFIDPTEGEARIGGIITHKEPLKAKALVGYVSENVMLYQHFTAIQNLDYFAKLGGQHHYTNSDYHEALIRVGLSESAHRRKLREFSKGMRQKCGIAIAILKNAPAIILDEPTSGLDPQAGYEFLRLLDVLRSEGKAILMSTHDIFRAREIADNIAIMNGGRILMQRSAAELSGINLEELYMKFMAGHTQDVAA